MDGSVAGGDEAQSQSTLVRLRKNMIRSTGEQKHMKVNNRRKVTRDSVIYLLVESNTANKGGADQGF